MFNIIIVFEISVGEGIYLSAKYADDEIKSGRVSDTCEGLVVCEIFAAADFDEGPVLG